MALTGPAPRLHDHCNHGSIPCLEGVPSALVPGFKCYLLVKDQQVPVTDSCSIINFGSNAGLRSSQPWALAVLYKLSV
jgi:hypothetical protein